MSQSPRANFQNLSNLREQSNFFHQNSWPQGFSDTLDFNINILHFSTTFKISVVKLSNEYLQIHGDIYENTINLHQLLVDI